MRNAAIVLLLLTGCASSTAGAHKINVRVAEVVSPRQPPELGTHHIRVWIRNDSEQPIAIQSIHLEPVGPDLYSNDLPQTFSTTLAPGESESFDLPFSVSLQRGHSTVVSHIDSLRVTIGCAAADGSFVESGEYSVMMERL